MPARRSFSHQFLNALKPREVTYELTDPGCPGLRIRVNKSGSKSWGFVYRHDGTRYRWTVGTFPGTSLESARTQVSEKREAVKIDGRNPVVEKRRRKAQLAAQSTIRELCDLYIENYAKARKRTWKEDKRILDKDVIPIWGNMRIGSVTRADVRDLTERIVKRGAPVQANRLFAVVRKMFNFACDQDILPTSPCDRLSKPSSERRRDRILSSNELVTFWHGLENVDIAPSTVGALRLILITAQRPGEVAALTDAELDLKGGWWTIPGGASEKRTHASRTTYEFCEASDP